MTNTATNTLTLFAVQCKPYYSEYGCLFVVAADDEQDARSIIEGVYPVSEVTFSDKHSSILNIGTANDTIKRGIVSEFTT